ncbi:MAG: flagellar basal body P-ring formation protein FlgA [Gammaproteobacteria bacterium]|nr:flagellar basal body P-ring formation protein FlgA [Gammaproteobacteria bacterium]MDE2250667.1 flagellar basal body P-ring formation protein FlgA [Gammaproteobacteria bacterium]
MRTAIAYRFATTAVALVLLKPVHAATVAFEDPANIQAAAESAVRHAAGAPSAQLLATVDALDPRLRLARCEAPLHAFVAGDGQLREHTTVAVRCESGATWGLYVGVALASQVPVLVAKRALARDAVPTAADFALITRRLPGLSSRYLSDAAQLAGQRLRRAIAMGEALDADALAADPIVHRGQQLTLLARASGMEVRVAAIALSDGLPDERIRVQNLASQRIVEATVRSAQLVEVPL